MMRSCRAERAGGARPRASRVTVWRSTRLTCGRESVRICKVERRKRGSEEARRRTIGHAVEPDPSLLDGKRKGTWRTRGRPTLTERFWDGDLRRPESRLRRSTLHDPSLLRRREPRHRQRRRRPSEIARRYRDCVESVSAEEKGRQRGNARDCASRPSNSNGNAVEDLDLASIQSGTSSYGGVVVRAARDLRSE
jgi:hypothetical protein